MGVARLLVAERDLGRVRAALGRAPASLGPAAAALRTLLDRHEAGARRVLALLEADATAAAASAGPDAGLGAARAFFDRAAAIDADAACAAAGLGDPDLLAGATAEVAALARALGVAGPGLDLLDLGCGAGRLLEALAPGAGRAVGVDLSPAMAARARARCAGASNVTVEVTEGRDLGAWEDKSFDGVLACDVFPYLFRAGGPALAGALVGEAARVLRPGGRLLALNLSYRGDPGLDRADAAAFAAAAGLRLLAAGERRLRSWDGLAFLFEMPGPGG